MILVKSLKNYWKLRFKRPIEGAGDCHSFGFGGLTESQTGSCDWRLNLRKI